MTLREQVVSEARTWQGTPYHHMGKVKGAGCDCVTFLLGVYTTVGLGLGVELPKDDGGREWYPPEWNLHRGDELYLDGLAKHAEQVPWPEPGDILMFKIGRTVSHAGIWLGNDQFIHSWKRSGGVVIAQMNEYWWQHLYGYYRPRGV